MIIARVQPDTTTRPPQLKGIYIALISQSGTNAPTAVVIKNSLPAQGNPIWSFTVDGVYTLTSTEINYFPVGLVTYRIQKNIYNGVDYFMRHNSTETIQIFTTLGLGGGGANGSLALTPIEIIIWDRLQD